MLNIIGFPEKSLALLMMQWAEKSYRTTQILTWLYQKKISDFERMTNLSKALRSRLNGHFYYALPKIVSSTPSEDGTIKYLLELDDRTTIESVWMPEESRSTLCISTQVGCRLACSFCLTGKSGLKRNLTSPEIIGQIMAVESDLDRKDAVSNIVFMGMGEPLDNYEDTVNALRLMVSPHAMKISNRKVTLSTSGLVDKIERFKEEDLHVNLAVSLNATEESTRSEIMPINKKHSLEQLLNCLRDYPLKPNRRITFEYVLIRGKNDSMDDAKRLVKLLCGFRCKINLIPFNSFDTVDYKPPLEERVRGFQNYLLDKNQTVFVRRNRGTDILAACGQLAGGKHHLQAFL